MLLKTGIGVRRITPRGMIGENPVLPVHVMIVVMNLSLGLGLLLLLHFLRLLCFLACRFIAAVGIQILPIDLPVQICIHNPSD